MSLASLVDALEPYCEGGNVYELVDGVEMGLRPAQVGEALYVTKVSSEPEQRGKGAASGAMEMLCELADEHSVELFLEVERGVYDSLRGKRTPQADSEALLSSAARDFIDDDAKDKIARAERRVADKIGRVCPGDLTSLFPGTCSGRAGTASDLAQCLNEAARCRGCKAAEGYGALTLDCEVFDNGVVDSSCQ